MRIGPSHEPVVRDVLGLSCERIAENTEEYPRIVAALPREEDVDFTGEHWSLYSRGRGGPC